MYIYPWPPLYGMLRNEAELGRDVQLAMAQRKTAKTMGSSEARMASRIVPNLGQEGEPLYLHIYQSLDVGIPG